MNNYDDIKILENISKELSSISDNLNTLITFSNDNIIPSNFYNTFGRIKYVETLMKTSRTNPIVAINLINDCIVDENKIKINEIGDNKMIFNKKEDFIKFMDLTVEACEASKVISTEELLYETNKVINEYNKNNDVKYTCETLEYLVDTIRDAMLYKGYYIRPQTELDWNLSSFGTTFFKYKDKEMWCTTLVGQGSEDMIGFNHPGLSDEFELWTKTNTAKKDELFPNLENVINDYYKWREYKNNKIKE